MTTKFCFIVGTGRSGTHYLAKLINDHPDIYDPFHGKEHRRLLVATTRAALMNNVKLPWRVILNYKLLRALAGGRVLLDQCHPNLFFVQEINSKLRGAKFLALWRDTPAVVSSMLEHHGVRRWQEGAVKYPFPNQFLGAVTRDAYTKLSEVEQCALRVIQHKNRISELAENTNNNVSVVQYRDMVLNPVSSRNKLYSALGLPEVDTLRTKPNVDSIHKWKTRLGKAEVRQIRQLEEEFANYGRNE